MLDSLRRVIIAMFGVILGLITQITVMLYGWGLKPKSWFFIVIVYVAGYLLSLFLVELAKGE